MSRFQSLRSRCLLQAALALAAYTSAAVQASAQQPAGHFRHAAQNPPGMIGAIRLQQGGPVHGYFQPVEISAPDGVLIAMAEQGDFPEAVDGNVMAGMLIGKPYRVQLLNMPEEFASREVYPTIEVIDRTYAPPGMERKFPIPVVFNENDLRLAAEGLMVTRVIYIEDPQQAIPGVQAPGDQLWHDAGPRANPLEVADQLGRPVAIVRIGGRQPDMRGGPDWQFLYGCPPWQRLSARVAMQSEPGELEQAPTDAAPQPAPTLQPSPQRSAPVKSAQLRQAPRAAVR